MRHKWLRVDGIAGIDDPVQRDKFLHRRFDIPRLPANQVHHMRVLLVEVVCPNRALLRLD